jgi:hypothetical protein
MSLDFRIGSLAIRNFRGIRELELEFADQVPSYLIGGNNSGKSTVMNAIALALKGGGFHLFTPAEFDYFHAGNGALATEFEIRLQLTAADENQLPAVQGVGAPSFVHGIQVEGTTDKVGSFKHTHRLYDGHGKTISFSQHTPLKAEVRVKFKDHDVGWKIHNARLDDIRTSVPDVWHLSADNLYRSLYEWRSGPLQRLARLLTNQFLSQEWIFNYGDKPQQMPKKIELLHDFFRVAVSEFPFWKHDLKPKLDESLSHYLGRQSVIQLQPSIQALEEWLAQQLLISFSAEAGGAVTLLKSMGQGWQSLVRVAALDVLRQYPDECKDKIVLLFEEPETYLHPHLRRKLRNVLGELAELGWFVVCATHAPEFISFSSSQHIVRLWRDGDQIDKGAFLTKSLSDAAKFQERLDEHGNHEMLFSNCVVLCEGKDDEFAVKEYFDKTDLDIDARSVSVLELGGVVNLPDYARMAQTLKIPWCGLTDEDKDATGAVNPVTEGVRKRLQCIQSTSDFVISWPGSLEASLGIASPGKAKPLWQEANLSPKSLKDVKSQYPDYASTCESISRWITASATGPQIVKQGKSKIAS